MAVRAHPDPIPNVVPPVDPGLDTTAEAARVADGNAENAQNLRFAQTERASQSKRLFKKSMQSWLRAILLEQPDNTTDEDLTINNLCKMDDYADEIFNEMSSTIGKFGKRSFEIDTN